MFSCTQCHAEFHLLRYLKNHLKLHKGSKQFECVKCLRRLKDNKAFKKHQKYNLFRKTEQILRQACKKDQAQTFFCEICQKCFSQRCNLKRHVKLDHQKDEDQFKPKCGICNREFWSYYHLEKHMSLHTEGMIFEEPIMTEAPKIVKQELDIEVDMINELNNKVEKIFNLEEQINYNNSSYQQSEQNNIIHDSIFNQLDYKGIRFEDFYSHQIELSEI